MKEQEKETPERSKIKTNLHPRNKNREQYDLAELLKEVPELKQHIKPNKYGEDSIRFSNPAAVKLLNKALLSNYYGIKNWNFPCICSRRNGNLVKIWDLAKKTKPKA